MEAYKFNNENSTPDSRTSRGQIALMLALVLPAACVIFMPVKLSAPPTGPPANPPASLAQNRGELGRGRNSKGNSKMALPSTVFFNGSGTAYLNESYPLHAGADASGNQFYLAGNGYGIIYDGTRYIVCASGDSGSQYGAAQYQSPVTPAGSVPLSGWTTAAGTDPPPTVSSSDPAAAPGDPAASSSGRILRPRGQMW